jgi:hypothetical protein
MNEYLNPQWEDAGRVHDWRNHVPDHIIEKWDLLDQEMKHDLYLWAEEIANNEEWD